MDKDKKRYIKWLCREIAKIDREIERLAKEKTRTTVGNSKNRR